MGLSPAVVAKDFVLGPKSDYELLDLATCVDGSVFFQLGRMQRHAGFGNCERDLMYKDLPNKNPNLDTVFI